MVWIASKEMCGGRGGAAPTLTWEGVAAAAGMGIGGVISAILVMLGLQGLLARDGWFFMGLKVAGPAYLVCPGLGCPRLKPSLQAPIEPAFVRDPIGIEFPRPGGYCPNCPR